MLAAHDRSVRCSDIEKIIFVASNTHKYMAKEGSRNFFCGRAPHGARGLKRPPLDPSDKGNCRAPHGARGLKQPTWRGVQTPPPSRPARGAWIETARWKPSQRLLGSRPARGAWIETDSGYIKQKDWTGRAPHGARGLKRTDALLGAGSIVAPRTGRVD